jgi:gliding motility-associated-like protein
MKKFIVYSFVLLLMSKLPAMAQPCSLPGMTPSNAIPVCGTAVFRQSLVTACTGPDIAIRGCNIGVTSSKSFWYKFTCFQTGTLGFLIRGISSTDDYDWSLLDITNRNPNEVFTNNSLQVSLNIYGTSGGNSGVPPNSPTGCTPTGNGDVHCEGDAAGNSPFNRMPTITQGRQYLLMVTNWTEGSTQGYDLVFTGGTASITDPVEPLLRDAAAACDGRQVRVRLNKKMKCNSLAANGSDFTINTPGNTIIGALGAGCSNGFDMDSVILTMSNPIAPGNYIVSMATGTDGNTLRDACDRQIPVGTNIPVTVFPFIPTPMDSLIRVGCAPDKLELVFKKPMFCNSIASDGSDFTVTGPSVVTVSGASGNCGTGGFSNKIIIQLSGPIQKGGLYTIRLQNGTDGNTIIDECGQSTPAGSFINFIVSDTVNAAFTYNIVFGCAQNTIQYSHAAANGVNSWLWNFDNNRNSSLQNPLITYSDFREKNTRLIVSNGVCSDTSSVSIFFDNLLQAKFEGSTVVCPGDPATFRDQSEGNINSWSWTFGNNNRSSLQNPAPQTYADISNTRNEIVQLIIGNRFGCFDTARALIKVVNNCLIAVPTAFSPNNDGVNDYLYPLNAYKARDLQFSVYNRFGQRLFYTTNWTNKWDGTFKGQGADPGTYVWVLQYTNTDTNLRVEQKGTVILIR